MALSAHLEKLHTKHGEIEHQISQEMRSPSPDTLRISQLKRQKLQIKDTIAQYKPGQA